MDDKPTFIYGIRNKETGHAVNHKSNTSNRFYSRRHFAEKKAIKDKEEIVKYLLVEVNT